MDIQWIEVLLTVSMPKSNNGSLTHCQEWTCRGENGEKAKTKPVTISRVVISTHIINYYTPYNV